MSDKIFLRRGNASDLPALGQGEPGFALDSKQLYIGTASGNEQIYAPFNQRSLFYAYKLSGTQLISAATNTKITFDSELYDYKSNYDASTSRFAAPETGSYLFSAAASVAAPADQTNIELSMYKNGIRVIYLSALSQSGTSNMLIQGSAVLTASAGDYFEVYLFSTGAITLNIAQSVTYFTGYILK